jgi:transcription factor IIIB 90 kDa subunit
MHSYIEGILTRLSHRGVGPRAITLFDNAMKAGDLRWGRKAKRTAGATVVIALRESGYGPCLDDVAVCSLCFICCTVLP